MMIDPNLNFSADAMLMVDTPINFLCVESEGNRMFHPEVISTNLCAIGHDNGHHHNYARWTLVYPTDVVNL